MQDYRYFAARPAADSTQAGRLPVPAPRAALLDMIVCSSAMQGSISIAPARSGLWCPKVLKSVPDMTGPNDRPAQLADW
jgi:hypothetical protein